MPSYASLLVLALAASTVTPVLSAEPPRENEGGASSRVKPVKRGLATNIGVGLLVGLGLTVTFAVSVEQIQKKAAEKQAAAAAQSTSSAQPTSTSGQSTSADQVTSTSPPTSTTPPWVIPNPTNIRRGKPSLARRSPEDNAKARSSLDNIRRTFSHFDLLNRADSEEELGFFSRMLDELD